MIDRSYSLLSSVSLAYTWRQLAQRAGVRGGDPQGTGFEGLNIPVHYAKLDEVHLDRPSIIVTPCSHGAWCTLQECAPHSLDWMPADKVAPRGTQLHFGDPIPVLFWGEGYEDGSKPFAELRSDRTVVFYVDIIAAAFFMLSRWEETVVQVRDKHGRFPAIASVASKQGFLDRPVVDEYAFILRAWLEALLPNWHPARRDFAVKLSHDIDAVHPFASTARATRAFAGDLFRRRDIRQACKTFKEAVTQLLAPQNTPEYLGIRFLASLSSEYGMDSAFYFMGAEPSAYDNGYDPMGRWSRQATSDLQKWGFEIGFHPGYYTYNNPERLAAEKARLDRAIGHTHYGGRQHYLRFQVPDTWLHWEQLGLTYDSTMTFADHEGFRCGTCHPFRPFDIVQDRELDLTEIPLIVMDGTLKNYRGLTPEEGENHILNLARRCQQVEGTFTFLWHNTSISGEWLPWAAMYSHVLPHLAAMMEENPSAKNRTRNEKRNS